MQKYYISEWALRRQAEIIELPQDFEIHSDYLKVLGKEKIISAVQGIRQMFFNIYQDIAVHPERFRMPVIEIRADELTPMGFPPSKALSSKRAPFMFFDALINVLISGDVENGGIIVNPEKLIYANQKYKVDSTMKSYTIKNIDCLYSQYESYGLYLEGLKNYKLTNDTERIFLCYPANPDLLLVLKWMADKAHKNDRRQDFMMCQYRLLQDDMKSLNYGKGADYIADRTHTRQEQNCVYQIDAALREAGLMPDVDNRAEVGGDDSYAVFYYTSKKDFSKREKSYYKLTSNRTKLYFSFRIKNIQNCAEHIKECSYELRSVFIPGDMGCSNRSICRHGQTYTIDGKEYWKCGCCNKLITFKPRGEDVTDYIKLVNLGRK